MSNAELRSAGYERSDARPKVIATSALALLLVVVVTFFSADLLERGLTESAVRHDVEPHPMAGARRPPTAALLQPDPPAHMRAFAARERELVETYGWIDREAGIVRLPVERAMELLAARAAQEGER